MSACYDQDMQIDPNEPRSWPAAAREMLQRHERATTGNPALAALIRARIHADGPIPFAEFMRLALYHPEYGYYASPGPKIGPDGDFLTAPETHPAFGALVCRRLARMWEMLGYPAAFTVVEAGAGTGALAAQILSSAAAHFPEFRRALRYTLVETSFALRARQQERLGAQEGVAWLPDLAALSPASVQGCILTNELLDALPVHRVLATAEGLRELYVALDGETFTEVTGPLSTPEIEAHFNAVGVQPPVGTQAEVGLAARSWYRRAAACLARGYLLTIDYGDEAAALYTAARPRGTLLCYYRHATNEDPYRRIGCQDITAHVDFTALRQAGEATGLAAGELVSQREWLTALGIGDWMPREARRPDPVLAALVDPNGLGRLKVLTQTRLE